MSKVSAEPEPKALPSEPAFSVVVYLLPKLLLGLFLFVNIKARTNQGSKPPVWHQGPQSCHFTGHHLLLHKVSFFPDQPLKANAINKILNGAGQALGKRLWICTLHCFWNDPWLLYSNLIERGSLFNGEKQPGYWVLKVILPKTITHGEEVALDKGSVHQGASESPSQIRGTWPKAIHWEDRQSRYCFQPGQYQGLCVHTAESLVCL